MRTLIAVTSLAMALTPALAQFDRVVPVPPAKIQDRHPAYFRDLIEERRVTTETIHSFEQRWEPVEQLLLEQRAREHLQRQNAPTGLPGASTAPVPKARPLVTAAAGDICTRHNLRKVWQGRSWRCR